MSFPDELADLFPDTVTVSVLSAPDYEGNTSVLTSVDLPARVTGKIKSTYDIGGNEKMSSVQALFPGAYGLTVDMEYLLPERFIPRNPRAISVGHATDESGAHHERVYFYWTQVG